MTRLVIALAAMLSTAALADATEYHVALDGRDTNAGTRQAPFRTIQRAADAAQPGDTVTVHAGIYRERIDPPRGGRSETERIVYRAAPGEAVEIRGSEVVKGWTRVKDDLWKAEIPAAVFGSFNPFADEIHGDWFDPKGRRHHTGAVYLDGEWLVEAPRLADVVDGAPSPVAGTSLWFAEPGKAATIVWARFPGADPNARLVEVNVRRAVFYPSAPGRNYITVRGFAMRQAAAPWAPPTAEQVALLGTHWSRGWVIEANTISHSTCSCVSLGKHGDRFDNTSADTAEGYVETIRRAHAHPIPWTRESIGHHVVRDNTISHCEQAGIVGSLGPAFSVLMRNTIHDVHVRALFSGAEMAGIKLHGAIDVVIAENHVYRTVRGLWMDWMAQGTRITRNLLHDNAAEDLFVEVDHGPFLVDDNVLLSKTSLLDVSEGGAYVHNLFGGRIVSVEEPFRLTPWHPAHSTSVAGLSATRGGDDRFLNNVFVGRGEAAAEGPLPDDRNRRAASFGLAVYDLRPLPLRTGGNVYLAGAKPYGRETDAVVRPGVDARPSLAEENGAWILRFTAGPELEETATRLVATETLGKAFVPQAVYENADGTPLRVDADFFGRPRDPERPTPGPFERPGRGEVALRLR
ncbi:MAG: right-handed parallel beta-helix repeat-containing protein [Vicinamibacteria bacterium]